MSMNETISAPLPNSFSVKHFVTKLAAWRRRRAVYRETYNELNRMTDRDLADLRMSRADFHYLASQAAAKA